MKIVSLTAENIKKLRAVQITPDGNLIQITGPNGSGKTSVLDSIFMALGGTKGHPSQPIRQGAAKATIKVDMGTIIVTRRFTEAGTSLVVENEEGSIFRSPQSMLDALLGELTFDPLAFSRMPAKGQLETLRKLVTLDVDLDALDSEMQMAYDTRTANNRTVKSLAERVATLAGGVDQTMDCTLVDEGALLEELEGASKHNTDLERRRDRRDVLANEIIGDRAVAAEKRERAADMIAAAEALERKADESERRLAEAEALPDVVDVSALTERVRTAQRENRTREAQLRQRELHRTAVGELEAAQARSEKLTQSISERTAVKQAAIAAAKYPVDGLSFGDGEVLYNGVPLAQASSAEQLRISVALAMAANPKLRILRITDGTLLDEHSLALITEMAKDQDYQCWVERVDTSGQIGIHMSDGAVVSIDGVPVAAQAPEQEVAAD